MFSKALLQLTVGFYGAGVAPISSHHAKQHQHNLKLFCYTFPSFNLRKKPFRCLFLVRLLSSEISTIRTFREQHLHPEVLLSNKPHATHDSRSSGLVLYIPKKHISGFQPEAVNGGEINCAYGLAEPL
ncbi:hypothetical protein DQ04_09651010 [Trypanosoma grayi]|uniref:hypothetical protein n=1 Tax=Trypanosoma grayi TaxID=71804 RepID=UPI0004F42061|nr:hypothetical protein DQ04_09651010 [Trypanosoma grayi]KEG07486.1 hypothetical protein DQ04_09651010 [Trypanosoma grayi]